MDGNNLIKIWEKASSDLGLSIITPFVLEVETNTFIEVDLLVKDFGADKGMLILQKFGIISMYEKKIIDMGYGYSVMSEPADNEEYIRSDFIELLNDWGWSGDPNMRPF